MNENEGGDSECLHKAQQIDTTDGDLFTDTSVKKRGDDE